MVSLSRFFTTASSARAGLTAMLAATLMAFAGDPAPEKSNEVFLRVKRTRFQSIADELPAPCSHRTTAYSKEALLSRSTHYRNLCRRLDTDERDLLEQTLRCIMPEASYQAHNLDRELERFIRHLETYEHPAQRLFLTAPLLSRIRFSTNYFTDLRETCQTLAVFNEIRIIGVTSLLEECGWQPEGITDISEFYRTLCLQDRDVLEKALGDLRAANAYTHSRFNLFAERAGLTDLLRLPDALTFMQSKEMRDTCRDNCMLWFLTNYPPHKYAGLYELLTLYDFADEDETLEFFRKVHLCKRKQLQAIYYFIECYLKEFKPLHKKVMPQGKSLDRCIKAAVRNGYAKEQTDLMFAYFPQVFMEWKPFRDLRIPSRVRSAMFFFAGKRYQDTRWPQVSKLLMQRGTPFFMETSLCKDYYRMLHALKAQILEEITVNQSIAPYLQANLQVTHARPGLLKASFRYLCKMLAVYDDPARLREALSVPGLDTEDFPTAQGLAADTEELADRLAAAAVAKAAQPCPSVKPDMLRLWECVNSEFHFLKPYKLGLEAVARRMAQPDLLPVLRPKKLFIRRFRRLLRRFQTDDPHRPGYLSCDEICDNETDTQNNRELFDELVVRPVISNLKAILRNEWQAFGYSFGEHNDSYKKTLQFLVDRMLLEEDTDLAAQQLSVLLRGLKNCSSAQKAATDTLWHAIVYKDHPVGGFEDMIRKEIAIFKEQQFAYTLTSGLNSQNVHPLSFYKNIFADLLGLCSGINGYKDQYHHAAQDNFSGCLNNVLYHFLDNFNNTTICRRLYEMTQTPQDHSLALRYHELSASRERRRQSANVKQILATCERKIRSLTAHIDAQDDPVKQRELLIQRRILEIPLQALRQESSACEHTCDNEEATMRQMEEMKGQIERNLQERPFKPAQAYHFLLEKGFVPQTAGSDALFTVIRDSDGEIRDVTGCAPQAYGHVLRFMGYTVAKEVEESYEKTRLFAEGCRQRFLRLLH